MTYTTKTASGFVLKSEWYQHPWMTSTGKLSKAPRDGFHGREYTGKWKGFKSWRAWADAQIQEAQQYAMEGA